MKLDRISCHHLLHWLFNTECYLRWNWDKLANYAPVHYNKSSNYIWLHLILFPWLIAALVWLRYREIYFKEITSIYFTHTLPTNRHLTPFQSIALCHISLTGLGHSHATWSHTSVIILSAEIEEFYAHLYAGRRTQIKFPGYLAELWADFSLELQQNGLHDPWMQTDTPDGTDYQHLMGMYKKCSNGCTHNKLFIIQLTRKNNNSITPHKPTRNILLIPLLVMY